MRYDRWPELRRSAVEKDTDEGQLPVAVPGPEYGAAGT